MSSARNRRKKGEEEDVRGDSQNLVGKKTFAQSARGGKDAQELRTKTATRRAIKKKKKNV